jgi:hypothetical protein
MRSGRAEATRGSFLGRLGGFFLLACGAVACREQASEGCAERLRSLADHGAEVVGESPGEAVSCDEVSAADRLALEALDVQLGRLPQAARGAIGPVRVQLWHPSGGRVGDPHVDGSNGLLIVDPRSPAVGDGTIWLHELAHVLVHTATEKKGRTAPAPPFAAPSLHAPSLQARLGSAVEEGLADYFASCAGGSTALGAIDGREPRDLSLVRSAGDDADRAAAWETLSLPAAGFSSHRLGGSLASLAFRAYGLDLDLATRGLQALRDAMQAAETTGNSPWSFLSSIARRGGPRAVDLQSLFERWLPSPLRPQEPRP